MVSFNTCTEGSPMNTGGESAQEKIMRHLVSTAVKCTNYGGLRMYLPAAA